MDGRHWFVCEALAGEPVVLEHLPLETVVVRFDDIYSRELDLEQKTASPLVRPAPSVALHPPSTGNDVS